MGDVIKQVSDALGKVFRHMLPGACIVIAARLSHPSWFVGVDYRQPQHLLLLVIIAVCAGNVWYVFHRYTAHQVIDWIAYSKLSRKNKKPGIGYREWLIGHVARSFRLRGSKFKLVEPVDLRASQIIFMCIVCEIILIFSICPEVCSWLGKVSGPCMWLMRIVAVLIGLCAVLQYWILFDVDRDIVGD